MPRKGCRRCHAMNGQQTTRILYSRRSSGTLGKHHANPGLAPLALSARQPVRWLWRPPLFHHRRNAASILFITRPRNKPMVGTMRAAALIGAAIWPPAAMTTTAAEMLPSLATLQREVAEQLRDPPTVRFRNIHIAHGADGKDRVCGDVNSRNAFAGYSGFLPFVSDILPDKRAGFPFIGTDWAAARVVRES